MQRDLFRSRFPHLPSESQGDEDAEEELDDFPATIPSRPLRKSKGKDYSPLSAAGYFADALEIDVPFASGSSTTTTATFRTYYTPPPNPSSSIPIPTLSTSGAFPPSQSDGPAKAPWANAVPSHLQAKFGGGGGGEGNPKGVVFVCVHGAGYSGLSWACFAKSIVEKGGGKAGVLSYDERGHGKTRLAEGETEEGLDMSLDALTADLVHIMRAMFPKREDSPSIVLVGHSMGGAVAVQACPLLQEFVNVAGIAVLDVVEGTAMEALSGMEALIHSQPKGFDSVSHGIEWHLRTKTISNPSSARVSVPSLLVPASSHPSFSSSDTSAEAVVWRHNLLATQPCWEGWFTGLSAKFLTCQTAKLLLLAGVERLDRELLVGQMQGKYQLDVFPDVGHCIQEDAPERTAELLLNFWLRNDRTDVLKGVKKVGER